MKTVLVLVAIYGALVAVTVGGAAVACWAYRRAERAKRNRIDKHVAAFADQLANASAEQILHEAKKGTP
jgi:Flp pilus assembly protein TadB